MKRLLVLMFLVTTPVQAGPLEALRDGYCKLYPSKCVTPSMPLPPEPQPVDAAPAPPPEAVPVPVARPQVVQTLTAPAVHRTVKKTPKIIKSKFKKRRYSAVELAAMPGLPFYYTCSAMRNYVEGKTKAQMLADGRRRGIALNPRQVKETCECGVKIACAARSMWS